MDEATLQQSISETIDPADAGKDQKENAANNIPDVFKITPVTTTIEVFSKLGGLALLARHLPVVYPETLRQIAVGSKFPYSATMNVDKDGGVVGDDWVKVENAEDFYEVR